MFRGFRYFAIAFGLILFAGLGQAQDQADEANRQTNQQQPQAQILPIPLPVEIITDKATADTSERRAKESEQREIEDLAAQQGMNTATQAMNEATQDMRDYTFYSTLLVAIGTMTLFYTLYLTRQSNAAAIAAVKVTREVGIAQTRSYISVVGGGYILNHGGFSGWADVINSGGSPAINPKLKFNLRLETAWFGGAMMGSQPAPFELTENIGRKNKIQPNETSRFYFNWVAEEFGDRFKSLDNERTTIVISCKVESETIYKGITDKGEWDLTSHMGFVRVTERSKISEGLLYTRQRQKS